MKFQAWSFSRWGDYDKCPQFAYYRHLEKLPEEKGEPLLRGSRVHKEAEVYLKAKRKPKKIPPSLRFFEEDFALLRKQKAVAEGRWAFDVGWNLVPYFDDKVWCRMIVDARTKNRIIDFKTGREYPKHDQQLELYAVGGFSADPTLQTIHAEMFYLDSGDSTELEFDRTKYYDSLVQTWDDRVGPMMEDNTFDPTPGDEACRWCPHGCSRGGPCGEDVR